MDETGHNVLSHSVQMKKEGKYLLKRRLTVLGYVAFCLVYIAVCTIPVKLYPVLAGVPFFLYALYKITWWRLEYDYDYTLAHGELTVEKVFSHSRRRKMATVSVKDASAVAPYDAAETVGREIMDLRGSAKAENSYMILYRNAEGKESALLFEGTAKFIKMMSRHNPLTVVREGLPF